MKKPTKTKYIEVRHSKIHGTGVYAKKDIPAETKIIEYVGEKITKEETENRTQKIDNNKFYFFELNNKWDIDGDVNYNTAKFINHSCDPNCYVDIVDKQIWIIADRDIEKGEELSYNYGWPLEDFEETPCNCGSKNCAGYIVDYEFRPKLKKILKRKKTKV